MKNDPIERLLRSAAIAAPEAGAEMPYGFDTRVVAQWRAGWPSDHAAIATMLRRVMLLAFALIVLAGAGTYREWHGDESADEYAIADSAIGGVFEQ